jgi:hypothetical protein
VAVLVVAVAVIGGSFSLTGAGAQSSPDPAQVGRFLPSFEDTRSSEGQNACHTDADGRQLCKPAGATVVTLANGKVLSGTFQARSTAVFPDASTPERLAA